MPKLLKITILIFFFYFSLLINNFALEAKNVCINNTCISAEIVNTPLARQKGLMGKERLRESEGMLFVFESSAQWGFWMKNMRFPIDIIWISEGMKVIDFVEDAAPCQESCSTLKPKQDARFVLEAPAGFIKRNSIKCGDRVNF